MSTWEERMSLRAAARRPPAPDPGPKPESKCCYEPKIDGPHGWLYFRQCRWDECDHEHHEGEVWIA